MCAIKHQACNTYVRLDLQVFSTVETATFASVHGALAFGNKKCLSKRAVSSVSNGAFNLIISYYLDTACERCRENAPKTQTPVSHSGWENSIFSFSWAM